MPSGSVAPTGPTSAPENQGGLISRAPGKAAIPGVNQRKRPLTSFGRQGTGCNCHYFDGELNEVRIWNVVRSPEKIQAGFNHPLAGWLQAYCFLTDGSADLTDPDADYLNNWQDCVAGTNPNHAASVLRIEGNRYNRGSRRMDPQNSWVVELPSFNLWLIPLGSVSGSVSVILSRCRDSGSGERS